MPIDERSEYRDMLLQQFRQHEDHLHQLRKHAKEEGKSERVEQLIHEGKSRLDDLEGEDWKEAKPYLDEKLQQVGEVFNRASEEVKGH
jgi:hypothetical protein